jgi:type II secretory pathway component PulK
VKYFRSYVEKFRDSKGVALIIVLSMVTLLSIVILSTTKATYVSSKNSTIGINRTKAEYILKSGLNIARVFIASSKAEYDPPRDSWGRFTKGTDVPQELLGITDPNLRLGLEITCEDSKMLIHPLKNIQTLGSGNPVYLRWREFLKNLFDILGFQNDNEMVRAGQFKGRQFKSEELVANIIDYLDEDKNSYNDGVFKGIEGDLVDVEFPNKNKLNNIEELANIPGFTPNRIRILSPYLSTVEANYININLASTQVLRALDNALDENGAQAIVNYALGEEGPFTPQKAREILPDMLPDFNGLYTNILVVKCQFLQVIGKVQYGDSRFFMRSVLKKDPGGDLPVVVKFELFG